MKTILYLTFIQLALLSSGRNQKLQSELLQMRAADQKILLDQMKANQPQGLPDTMQTEHRTKLWQIFRTYGYPDYDLVDTAGADAFYLLVQHQNKDTVLQKAVLSAMREKVKQGKASPQNMAYLTDRTLFDTGNLQIYGTQFMQDSMGTYVPLPMAYPNRVDSLRQTVGLATIAEYIQMINSLTIDSTGNIYYGNKNPTTSKK